jgi:hypothetical protein
MLGRSDPGQRASVHASRKDATLDGAGRDRPDLRPGRQETGKFVPIEQVDARDEKPIAALPADARKGGGGMGAILRVSEIATRTSARRHARQCFGTWCFGTQCLTTSPFGSPPSGRSSDGRGQDRRAFRGRHENSRTRGAGLPRFNSYLRPHRSEPCRIRQARWFRGGHHRTDTRHPG